MSKFSYSTYVFPILCNECGYDGFILVMVINC